MPVEAMAGAVKFESQLMYFRFCESNHLTAASPVELRGKPLPNATRKLGGI